MTLTGGIAAEPGSVWSMAVRFQVDPASPAVPLYLRSENQYSPAVTVQPGGWGILTFDGVTSDSNLGFSLSAGPGGVPQGARFVLTDALIEQAPVAGSLFNGAYNDTDLIDYYWEGEAFYSRSFEVTQPVPPGDAPEWIRVTEAVHADRTSAPTRVTSDQKFAPDVGPEYAMFYPSAMDPKDRTTMINHNSSALRFTKDEGETWTVAHEFTGFPVRSGLFLDNGEVLVAVRSNEAGSHLKLMLSHGWADDPTEATWSEVLEFTTPGAYPSGGFSYSTHENIVVVSEYGPKIGVGGSEVAARYVYASRDYGKTWTTIFDLLTDHPAADITTGLHIHGVCYDPYWDRIWVTHGDDRQATLYSDDFGKTWEVAIYTDWEGTDSFQVVGIIALPKAILFASDGPPNGIQRINRSEGKHKGAYRMENAYRYDQSDGLTVLCQNIFRGKRPGDDAPAVFEFCSAPGDGKRFVVTTSDGYTFNKVWEDQEVTTGNTSGRAVGPTTTGRLLIYAADGRFGAGSRTLWAGPMPSAY